MAESMPDEVFDRLTSLERAQFLSESAQRRHAEAIDRYEAMHQDHAARMGHLETLLERQQEMQATLLTMIEETRTRITQNEAMLQRLIDLQRHRNGH
jgi:hypothetical protein